MVIFLLVCGASLANAQQPGNFDPSQLQRLFQDPAAMERTAAEAEAAQKCMEGIDQNPTESDICATSSRHCSVNLRKIDPDVPDMIRACEPVFFARVRVRLTRYMHPSLDSALPYC